MENYVCVHFFFKWIHETLNWRVHYKFDCKFKFYIFINTQKKLKFRWFRSIRVIFPAHLFRSSIFSYSFLNLNLEWSSRCPLKNGENRARRFDSKQKLTICGDQLRNFRYHYVVQMLVLSYLCNCPFNEPFLFHVHNSMKIFDVS